MNWPVQSNNAVFVVIKFMKTGSKVSGIPNFDARILAACEDNVISEGVDSHCINLLFVLSGGHNLLDYCFLPQVPKIHIAVIAYRHYDILAYPFRIFNIGFIVKLGIILLNVLPDLYISVEVSADQALFFPFDRKTFSHLLT